MKTKPPTLLSFALGILIANSAAAANNAVHWGDILDVPNRHYILTQDLSGVGTAITITADHVILDLNGHTIAPAAHPPFGLNSTGVLVKDVSHVQIMNGTISGFSYGIRMETVEDSQVKKCSLANNSRGVVLWFESKNNQVKNNEVSGSSFGIMVGPQVSPTAGDGTASNSIKENNCFHNFYAIYVRGDANEVKENDTSANSGVGVNVWGNSNLVKENVANNNATGILIRSGTGNEVRENTANNNTITTTFFGVHGGIVLGVAPFFNAGSPSFAKNTLVIGNTALGNDGGSPSFGPLPVPPFISLSLDVADNSLTTFYSGHTAVCENTWEENIFNSDNELLGDFGPGAGCVQ
jgi:parallel beta-helix repeat protein